jgi:dUTP pyrophosphatase
MTTPKKIVCEVKGEYAPQNAKKGDAGSDLRASEEITIPSKGRCLVPTGISMAIPSGYVGLIWPRSGLAVKHGIDSGAGVIDSGYRGEIRVLLFNHSDADFKVAKGDRIAQILIQKVETPQFVQVETLDETERGAGGFGSTGK